MGHNRQEFKRDNFKRFQRHTRVEKRGNVTYSDSSDNCGSSSYGHKWCGIVKIEANGGSSTARGYDTSLDSGDVYEVCKCGQVVAKGIMRRQATVKDIKLGQAATKSIMWRQAAAKGIMWRQADNLGEKMDALVAKVGVLTGTNTHRRMSLVVQLDLVIEKLDAFVAKVDDLTSRNTQRSMSLADQLDLVIEKPDVVIEKLF
ncbi:hypothetical protein GUJ93_ZPchr0001g31894 [Zizania palustris]|uniref:Uncharacterized protein n=1 Tax=Zizania palustris TaxID=103762 RepID=A0A8J5RWP9_ZIZPA|nr:hypothetical protein GUJ93_ZPchr0001g31894 [Zizania palustris]